MHRCRERRLLGTVWALPRPRPLRRLRIGLGKVHARKKKLSSGRLVTYLRNQIIVSCKAKMHGSNKKLKTGMLMRS